MQDARSGVPRFGHRTSDPARFMVDIHRGLAQADTASLNPRDIHRFVIALVDKEYASAPSIMAQPQIGVKGRTRGGCVPVWKGEREHQPYIEPQVCQDSGPCVPEGPVNPMVEESAVRGEEWTSFIAEGDDLFTPHPDEALAKRK